MAVRTMNEVHDPTTCSVAACAEIIGAKWTALLVHDLSEGPRRFSELEHSCSGISPRTFQYEVGLMFGPDPPWQIWGISLPRLGFGYREAGVLSGWRLVLGDPF